jgi:hypothetical protein
MTFSGGPESELGVKDTFLGETFLGPLTLISPALSSA